MRSNFMITASHNSHINPYNSIGLILYFIRDSYLLLSKHNRTQAIYDQNNYSRFTENCTYEYDNGLPKKMVLSRDSGGPFGVTTINFYYN